MGAAKPTLVVLFALLALLAAVHAVRVDKQQRAPQLRQLAPGSPVSPPMLDLLELTSTHLSRDEDDGPINMRVYDITNNQLCKAMTTETSAQALTHAEFCREVVDGKELCTPDVDEEKLEEEFKLLDQDALQRYLNWVQELPENKRIELATRQLVKKYACLAAGFIPKPDGHDECHVVEELAQIGVTVKASPLIQMTDQGVALPDPEDDQAFFYFTTTTHVNGQAKCPKIPVHPHDKYKVMVIDPDELPAESPLPEEEVEKLADMGKSIQDYLKAEHTASNRKPLVFLGKGTKLVKPTDQQKAAKPSPKIEELIKKIVDFYNSGNLIPVLTRTLTEQLKHALPQNGKEVEQAHQPVQHANQPALSAFTELSAKVSSKLTSTSQYNVVAAGKVPHDQIIVRAAALVVPGFLYDSVFWKGTKYPDVPEAKNQYTGEEDYGGRHVAPKAWYKDINNVKFDGVVGKLSHCSKVMKNHNVKTKIRYNFLNCMNWKVNFREQPWHSSATPMILLKTDKVDEVTEFETAQNARRAQLARSMTGLKYKATVNNRQARHLAVGAILRWVHDCLVEIQESGDEGAVIEAFSQKCNKNNRDNKAACMCKSLLGHAMHTIADSFPPSHTQRANLQANQENCLMDDLPNYTIEDFYSVDVQDPYRHKLADNVFTDGFAKCAVVASAGLINEVLDVRHTLWDRLHNVRDYLCHYVYPVRAEKLPMPAGGAPASLAGNFMVQKPTQVVRVPGDNAVTRTTIATQAWTLHGNHLANDPNAEHIFNPWREEYEAQENNPPQPDANLVARDYHPELPDDVPYDDLALEKIWDNQDVCT